jgi:octopine/nopaline transport system permease protein
MSEEIAFLTDVFRQLLGGLPLTLELTVVSVACGAVLALAMALLRTGSRIGAAFVSFYVFVFRGSPLLLQIFFIYYGLGQFAFVRNSFAWPALRDPTFCAILALALNTTAYTSEILRGGLASVPKGAIEAGRTVGMSRVMLLRRVVLPLAIRQALPAYSNEMIAMVKSTSLASIVTLMEISGVAYALVSSTYRAVEVLSCAGTIYLALIVLLTRGVGLVETWLSPAGSRA